jgi:hypothetical protein
VTSTADRGIDKRGTIAERAEPPADVRVAPVAREEREQCCGAELVAATRADGEPEAGRLEPGAASGNRHVYSPPVGRGRAARPRSQP